VSENKKGSWTLRILLLACAGALLIILLTLTSSIEEVKRVQQDRIANEAISGCGAVSHLKYILPISQQIVSGDCTPEPEIELR
jgi:hypothetical protein